MVALQKNSSTSLSLAVSCLFSLRRNTCVQATVSFQEWIHTLGPLPAKYCSPLSRFTNLEKAAFPPLSFSNRQCSTHCHLNNFFLLVKSIMFILFEVVQLKFLFNQILPSQIWSAKTFLPDMTTQKVNPQDFPDPSQWQENIINIKVQWDFSLGFLLWSHITHDWTIVSLGKVIFCKKHSCAWYMEEVKY